MSKSEQSKASWRELILEVADGDVILDCTLSEADLDVRFDDDFGRRDGRPFTAWSKRYVYFPITYEGAEWVGRAPRDPCGEATKHVGDWMDRLEGAS